MIETGSSSVLILGFSITCFFEMFVVVAASVMFKIFGIAAGV